MRCASVEGGSYPKRSCGGGIQGPKAAYCSLGQGPKGGGAPLHRRGPSFGSSRHPVQRLVRCPRSGPQQAAWALRSSSVVRGARARRLLPPPAAPVQRLGQRPCKGPQGSVDPPGLIREVRNQGIIPPIILATPWSDPAQRAERQYGSGSPPPSGEVGRRPGALLQPSQRFQNCMLSP